MLHAIEQDGYFHTEGGHALHGVGQQVAEECKVVLHQENGAVKCTVYFKDANKALTLWLNHAAFHNREGFDDTILKGKAPHPAEHHLYRRV